MCGPCMCGATDCPSCGPAQGYRLVPKEDDTTADDVERWQNLLDRALACHEAGAKRQALDYLEIVYTEIGSIL